MQNKSVATILKAAAQLAMACGVLIIAGSPAWADDEAKCTNKTLQGDYGFRIEGVILTLPGGAIVPPGGLPLRGVAMSHFDGKGQMTQVDHIVANGVPPPVPWAAGSGPYTVNPNCTGTMTINIPGSPFSPVTLHFVVVRNGKEIRTVVENGSASTSIGVKID